MMDRSSVEPAAGACQYASSALALPCLKAGAADFRHRCRSLRVTILIVAIIALSLGDLAMTLTFLRSVGMGEANPIARLVIGYNSPALLVIWKCASVLLACLIFARYRHRRFTEMACWGAVIVLAGLTFQWRNYVAETTEISQHLSVIAHAPVDRTNWVQLSD